MRESKSKSLYTNRAVTRRESTKIYTSLISKSLLLFFFLFLFIQAASGGEQHPVKLKIVMSPYITFAPFFIAMEEGYFSENKLQVDFVRMDEPFKTMPALIKGDLHVVSGFFSASFLNSISRGARVKFVADKGYIDPTSCTTVTMIARRALVEAGELSSPAQLKGRRIGMTQSSSVSGYYFEKILSSGGLTFNDVEYVNIPISLRSEALQRGAIDLTPSNEPWVTRTLEAGHGVIWMPAEKIIPDFQTAVILYGPSLLDKDKEAGQRFMVAYLKGVRQYNQGKTERNLQILVKHTGLDKGLLEKVCWPSLRRGGGININSILDFQSWAIKRGFLDREVYPFQFWDPSFIEYANRFLGTAKQ